MSARSSTFSQLFEVRVEEDTHHRMLTYRGHSSRDVSKQARKDGHRVVSCRKVDRERVLGNIERLQLHIDALQLRNNEIVNTQVSAIAMEEIAFGKRIKRIENRERDKSGLDS